MNKVLFIQDYSGRQSFRPVGHIQTQRATTIAADQYPPGNKAFYSRCNGDDQNKKSLPET